MARDPNQWLPKPKVEDEPDPLDLYLAARAAPPGVPGLIALFDRDLVRGSEEWPIGVVALDEAAKEIQKLYETTLGCAHSSRAVARYYEAAERLWAAAKARRPIRRKLPHRIERRRYNP